MFACPNCGGNIKFDIPSQQLCCEHCSTLMDPYSFDDKEKDAVERKEFDTTIFTCPQCGGEILSTDTSAAEFCSFCGASTILFSRISKEKRPDYIIPFKQTKEDCKNAYSKIMKRAIFAPDALKNPKNIDSFRGIYIPYWAFYMTQKGPFTLNGSRSKRRGDFIYTDHYTLHGEMDAYYKGLSYDASSSFDDNISERLAPYDVKGMKAFTPAYLSGFYADTADVDAEVYKADAENTAFNNSVGKVYSSFPSIDITTAPTSASINTEVEAIDSTMFPVWFMSYRNGDRVAYATINGQTGRVVADLPIDSKKYLIGSLLLAIPIFILLNLFLTITPSSLLLVTSILGILSIILYSAELSALAKKEAGLTDRGRTSKQQPEVSITATKKPSKLSRLLVIIAIALDLIIFFLNPANDIIFYSGVGITSLAIFFIIKDIIKYYNVLSTRRLPQFDRTGGDDRA